jgi:biopolymer transport protein ExbD
MIDVVFLLLVFFMLVSRFGADQILPLPMAGGTNSYEGPPRLIDVHPNALLLNGVPVNDQNITAAVAKLMAKPTDTIILRGQDGAQLQRIVTVLDVLSDAGYSSVVLVE